MLELIEDIAFVPNIKTFPGELFKQVACYFGTGNLLACVAGIPTKFHVATAASYVQAPIVNLANVAQAQNKHA